MVEDAAKMSKCLCMRFEDEMELILNVETGEYQLLPDVDYYR